MKGLSLEIDFEAPVHKLNLVVLSICDNLQKFCCRKNFTSRTLVFLTLFIDLETI